MADHEPGTASVVVGVQRGGSMNTFEFGFVTDHVLREAASHISLRSFDERVKDFGILLRVSGTLIVFEGQDVESVRFGRGRSYVSVDWLYAERLTAIRDFEVLLGLVLSRLRKTPNVVADVCTRRKVAIDEALFMSECEEMGKLITMYARDRARFEEWKGRMLELERQSRVGFKCYH